MLRELHAELGIPENYGVDGTRPRFEEATDLIEVGPNPIGRIQRLTPGAAGKWHAMQAAAAEDEVMLLVVSGYRSIDYQASLIRKKLNAGQSLGEILAVNAAPGYSEHHTGRAVDIASPGSRPLTREFEDSDAFRWLEQHAASYGFLMSYPRDNAAGFAFEPWHWSRPA